MGSEMCIRDSIRKEHSNSPELIVLLEGSLAVTSEAQFIMRLNNPGDLVGELSVIAGESNNLPMSFQKNNQKL